MAARAIWKGLIDLGRTEVPVSYTRRLKTVASIFTCSRKAPTRA